MYAKHTYLTTSERISCFWGRMNWIWILSCYHYKSPSGNTENLTSTIKFQSSHKCFHFPRHLKHILIFFKWFKLSLPENIFKLSFLENLNSAEQRPPPPPFSYTEYKIQFAKPMYFWIFCFNQSSLPCF